MRAFQQLSSNNSKKKKTAERGMNTGVFFTFAHFNAPCVVAPEDPDVSPQELYKCKNKRDARCICKKRIYGRIARGTFLSFFFFLYLVAQNEHAAFIVSITRRTTEIIQVVRTGWHRKSCKCC